MVSLISTGFFDSLLKIPFPSANGRWFIVYLQKAYLKKDMQIKWMAFIMFTFGSLEKAVLLEATDTKQEILQDEIVNPAVVGTTIEREHSYSKPAIEDPDDTAYLYEDE
ncbi:hypothetical protein OUZ56_018727 [Daphnia magna]|uniref:Uncharacterized protein n=1 Tax=Daphnia magna TaxID=35525 RepID=A0ABQ9Z9M7_9CRUS|nr:hypothetical protein OUZ56_018727 [Daphnia magna]